MKVSQQAQLNPGRYSSVGEGCPKNKETEITSSPTNWMSTQIPNLKVSNYKEDTWIYTQRWEETSTKRLKTSKIRIPLLLQGISSPSAREQGLMENECDELSESGFRRWIIRNFCELKEHVLTQCKETKNLEKRLDKMLRRINNLESNISELMELKNTRTL